MDVQNLTMHKLHFTFTLLLFVMFQACGDKENQFKLQTGDLLFSVGAGNSELLVAIQTSTGRDKDIPFTHVGIVSIENDKTHVLEATSPEGVVKTPVEEFFEKTALLNGKYLMAVGRVKKEFEYTIPNAIKNAEKHLGKEYDYAYDETNNQFYCSELNASACAFVILRILSRTIMRRSGSILRILKRKIAFCGTALPAMPD
jgi:hypothetical protein